MGKIGFKLFRGNAECRNSGATCLGQHERHKQLLTFMSSHRMIKSTKLLQVKYLFNVGVETAVLLLGRDQLLFADDQLSVDLVYMLHKHCVFVN